MPSGHFVMKVQLARNEVEEIVLEYLSDLLPSFEDTDDKTLRKDCKAIKRVIEVVKA